MNTLRREQTRLESAAKILDGNLYSTFVFLKQCAEMDALPMEKRKDALSFARAMTALEGLAAKEETEQNLLLWARRRTENCRRRFDPNEHGDRLCPGI